MKILHVGPSHLGKGGISSVLSGYINSREQFKDEGIDLIFLETPSFKSKTNIFKFILLTLPKLLIKSSSADLIHIHLASNGSFIRKFLVFTLSKTRRKPILLHLHGAGFMEYYDNASSLIKKLIQLTFNHSQRIVTVSSEFKSSVLSRFPKAKNVCVIHNSSVEFENLEDQAAHSDDDYILFSGRLSIDKGLNELIQALAELRQLGRSYKLRIAGNGDIDYWKKIAQNYLVDDLIKFDGWVTGDEKIRLYINAKIFCLPSHCESFDISALEAMYAGLPSICTKLGGFLDLVDDGITGFLVESRSPSQIAQKIDYLMTHPVAIKDMGDAARAKAGMFNSFLSNKLLIESYQHIIRSEKRV